MQIATVVGNAVATIKHASLSGWRLLVVQPLTPNGDADGEPLLAIDSLGARRGDAVLICNDGLGARELVKAKNSPARWFVMGLRDSG